MQWPLKDKDLTRGSVTYQVAGNLGLECLLSYLLHFYQLLVKIQEGFRSGDESVQILKQAETRYS